MCCVVLCVFSAERTQNTQPAQCSPDRFHAKKRVPSVGVSLPKWPGHSTHLTYKTALMQYRYTYSCEVRGLPATMAFTNRLRQERHRVATPATPSTTSSAAAPPSSSVHMYNWGQLRQTLHETFIPRNSRVGRVV